MTAAKPRCPGLDSCLPATTPPLGVAQGPPTVSGSRVLRHDRQPVGRRVRPYRPVVGRSQSRKQYLFGPREVRSEQRREFPGEVLVETPTHAAGLGNWLAA